MKTPVEFEPIAVWMGWKKRKLHVCFWWEDGKGIDLGAIETKTSLTDAEAMGAILRLTSKGYAPQLVYDDEGNFQLSLISCGLAGEKPGGWLSVLVRQDMWHPTISAAVEEALLRLIAAEKQTQCCTK